MIITARIPMDVDGLDAMWAIQRELEDILGPNEQITDSGFGFGGRDYGIQTSTPEITLAKLRKFFDGKSLRVVFGEREAP